MRDWIRAACEIVIYAAERILEVLDTQRPLHDEPLPEGHTDHWPDEPRSTLSVYRGDYYHTPCPCTVLPAVAQHLLARAQTQWGSTSADPRMN